METSILIVGYAFALDLYNRSLSRVLGGRSPTAKRLEPVLQSYLKHLEPDRHRVRDLVSEYQQAAAAVAGGKLGSSNRVGMARYGPTPGVEFRSQVADKILRVYRDVYLPKGRPKIGPEFAQNVVDFLAAPRIKMKIHFLPQGGSDGAEFSPEQLRNLRRYIKRAEAYMEAAAQGDFPGRSSFI